MRKCNAAGRALIKASEGLALESYLCPAGKWTIGWGVTGPEIHQGMRVTEEQAEEMFDAKLREFERCVETMVVVPINDNQFSALVSFAFNLGCARLQGSSLLQLLNMSDDMGAADQFPRWVYGGGAKLPGLVKRRAAERALFLAEV